MGRKKKTRRGDDGWVSFDPSKIGEFTTILPVNIFGHVPVGQFVRSNIANIFNHLDVDVFECFFNDVSFFFNFVFIFTILFVVFIVSVGRSRMAVIGVDARGTGSKNG